MSVIEKRQPPLFDRAESKDRAKRKQHAMDQMNAGVGTATLSIPAVGVAGLELGDAGRAFRHSNRHFAEGVEHEAKNRPFTTTFSRQPEKQKRWQKKTKPVMSSSKELAYHTKPFGVKDGAKRANAWNAHYAFAEGARLRKIGQRARVRGIGAGLAGAGLLAGGTALTARGVKQNNRLKQEHAARRTERRGLAKSQFEISKRRRSSDDKNSALAATGATVSAGGLLGGGVPGLKSDPASIKRIKRGTPGQRVAASAKSLRGGIFGYRADAHRSFWDKQARSNAKNKVTADTSHIDHFMRGLNRGKMGPERQIIRTMKLARVGSHAALAGGAGLTAYGVHRIKSQNKVSKAEGLVFSKARSDTDRYHGALAGAGATVAGGSVLGARKLEQQGRKWSERSADKVTEAARLVPNLGLYKKKTGANKRVPDVVPDYETHHVQGDPFHRLHADKHLVEQAGKLRGEATQARYFARVYGSSANMARKAGLAGGAVAAVGAGGLALSRRKHPVRKSLFAKSEGLVFSKADWQTLENIDRSASKQRGKQRRARVAGSAGLAAGGAALVADLQGTGTSGDSFSQAGRLLKVSPRNAFAAARNNPRGAALLLGGGLAAGGGGKYAYHRIRENSFNKEAATRRRSNHRSYLKDKHVNKAAGQDVVKSFGSAVLKPLKAMKAPKAAGATARTAAAGPAGHSSTFSRTAQKPGFLKPGKTTDTKMTWGANGSSNMNRTTTIGRKDNFLYRPAKTMTTTNTSRIPGQTPHTTSTTGRTGGQFTNKGKVAAGAVLGAAGTQGVRGVQERRQPMPPQGGIYKSAFAKALNTQQRKRVALGAGAGAVTGGFPLFTLAGRRAGLAGTAVGGAIGGGVAYHKQKKTKLAKSSPDQADAHVIGTLKPVKRVRRKAG